LVEKMVDMTDNWGPPLRPPPERGERSGTVLLIDGPTLFDRPENIIAFIRRMTTGPHKDHWQVKDAVKQARANLRFSVKFYRRLAARKTPEEKWVGVVLVMDPPGPFDPPGKIWRFIRELEASEYRAHPDAKWALRHARRDLRCALRHWVADKDM
jgi:hypothetical protein